MHSSDGPVSVELLRRELIRLHAENETLKGGGGGGTSDGMEARVQKLEEGLTDVRVTLARIEEKLNSLASKEDLIPLNRDLGELKGDVRGRLGLWQFLLVMAAVVGLFLRWPQFFQSIGVNVGG